MYYFQNVLHNVTYYGTLLEVEIFRVNLNIYNLKKRHFKYPYNFCVSQNYLRYFVIKQESVHFNVCRFQNVEILHYYSSEDFLNYKYVFAK